MPQIGIHHQVICRNNTLTRELFGWFQWWHKLQPTQYFPLSGFVVETGDTVMAYLTVEPGGNAANLIIRNLSTGFMPIPVDMSDRGTMAFASGDPGRTAKPRHALADGDAGEGTVMARA